MFALQFEDTATQGAVAVKDLIKYENAIGGTALNSNTDQIWTYKKGEGWKKYYWYQGKSDGPWWSLSGTKTAIGNEVSISAGDSFFFVRSGSSKSSDVTLSVAGAVVALDAEKGIPVSKSETILLCNPWPTSIKIANMCNYYSNPIGGTALNSNTDQVWTYRGGEWQKYYYYQGKSDGPWWSAQNTKTAIGDDVKIEAGEGFFFVRSGSSKSSDVTLTFKGPDAK